MQPSLRAKLCREWFFADPPYAETQMGQFYPYFTIVQGAQFKHSTCGGDLPGLSRAIIELAAEGWKKRPLRLEDAAANCQAVTRKQGETFPQKRNGFRLLQRAVD